MERHEAILKILQALNSSEKAPTEEDLELDKQEYCRLLKSMQEDDLISGFDVRICDGRFLFYWTEYVDITTYGIQHLKAYKKVEITEAHNRVIKYIHNSKFVSAKLLQDDVFGGKLEEEEVEQLLADLLLLDYLDDTLHHLTNKGIVYCMDKGL